MTNNIGTTMFYQTMELSHDEKVAMYMKCKKKDLIEMIIHCNLIIENLKPEIVYPIEGTSYENLKK